MPHNFLYRVIDQALQHGKGIATVSFSEQTHCISAPLGSGLFLDGGGPWTNTR